jgi:hypothetical protein
MLKQELAHEKEDPTPHHKYNRYYNYYINWKEFHRNYCSPAIGYRLILRKYPPCPVETATPSDSVSVNWTRAIQTSSPGYFGA